MASPAALAQTGPGAIYAAIPEGAFAVVAEIQGKPGLEAELLAATLPLISLVWGDPKTLSNFRPPELAEGRVLTIKLWILQPA